MSELRASSSSSRGEGSIRGDGLYPATLTENEMHSVDWCFSIRSLRETVSMDEHNFELAAKIIGGAYVKQGREAHRRHQHLVKVLLEHVGTQDVL